jgi:hypothetical protein
MPFKDPDPTDPNILVGVMLPAQAEATRDMAYVFAEEFARLGYSREQLLWLFKNPFYGGAHGAYQALGEQEVLAIVDECLAVWGSIRVTVQDVQSVQTDQAPSFILPRPFILSSSKDTGEERDGSSPAPNERINLRNGLNGAKRLNDLNGLNPRREESDDE